MAATEEEGADELGDFAGDGEEDEAGDEGVDGDEAGGEDWFVSDIFPGDDEHDTDEATGDEAAESAEAAGVDWW